MKKVIFLVFLFPALPLFAKRILIGHKTGSVRQVGMQGLQPGDTLAIRAGNYMEGGEFRDLLGITIINDRGVVHFGSGLTIGGLIGVTISGGDDTSAIHYGLRFSAMTGDAIMVDAPCAGMKIFNCQYDSVMGNILSAYKLFSVYNGVYTTLALYNIVLANQRLIHSGPLLAGSFEPVTSFHNVIDSISMYNIIIDTTLTDGSEVVGNSIYRMSAHDWIIRGGTPNGKHDVGVFMTHGNGAVYNIFRTGGWGYIWRLWNVGLNGQADSYLYNCIDLATTNYGTIDTRIDPVDTTTGSVKPFLRGGSIHVLNNTAGNKKDVVGYVSVLVVAGEFFPQNGYVVEVRNNLGFHSVIRNTNGILLINTSSPVTDTSNNLYVEDAIGSGVLSDTSNCYIRTGSPLIDNGQSLPVVTADIGGIRRPQDGDYDIGARESPATGTNHHHIAESPPIKIRFRFRYLLIPIGIIGFCLLLVFNRRFRKRKTKEAPSYPSVR